MNIEEMIGRIGRIKPGIEPENVKHGFPSDSCEITKPFIIHEVRSAYEGKVVVCFTNRVVRWVLNMNQIEIIPIEDEQNIILKAEEQFVKRYMIANSSREIRKKLPF